MLRVHATYIIVVYVTCELIANVTAGKITTLGVFSVPAAIYIFALTFTLIDLVNEGLGKKAAQRVVYAAFAANILLALYSLVVVRLPSPVWFKGTESYSIVFGLTPRIVLASLTAYLISSLLDVELFAALRERINPGLRVVASNAASTLVDSVVFIGIAFLGAFPLSAVGMLVLGQYIVKLAVTAVSVPLIYLVRATVEIERPESV